MSFTIPNNGGANDNDLCVWMSADIDALVRGFNGDGVLTGCVVTAQGSPDMTVAVAAGTVQIGAVTVAVTGANGTITTADGSNPRLDVISINSSGVIVVTAGTPAAEPAAPSIPASSAILALVHIPASDTTISSSQIVDKRVIVRLIGVQVQETTLTNAQILALGSTPIVVVTAPGAGFVNYLISVLASCDASAGVYSNPTIRFRYSGDTTDLVTGSSSTLNSATKRIQSLRSVDFGISASVASNKDIEVSASTTVTGGNAANQYRIRVTFIKMAVL